MQNRFVKEENTKEIFNEKPEKLSKFSPFIWYHGSSKVWKLRLEVLFLHVELHEIFFLVHVVLETLNSLWEAIHLQGFLWFLCIFESTRSQIIVVHRKLDDWIKPKFWERHTCLTCSILLWSREARNPESSQKKNASFWHSSTAVTSCVTSTTKSSIKIVASFFMFSRFCTGSVPFSRYLAVFD